MPHRFSNGYNHSSRDTPEVKALYNKYFLGKHFPVYSTRNTRTSNSHLSTEQEVGIPVADPAKYGLRSGYPSKKDPSVEAYIPSFIHQFHCLVRPLVPLDAFIPFNQRHLFRSSSAKHGGTSATSTRTASTRGTNPTRSRRRRRRNGTTWSTAWTISGRR